MRFVIIFFLLMLSAAPFQSTFASEITEETLNELLTSTGTIQALENFPKGIKVSMHEQFKSKQLTLSKEKMTELDALLEKSFALEVFINEFSVLIKEDISEEEAQQLISWYRSDVGRKIIDEALTFSSEEPNKIMEKIQALSKELRADEQRVDFAVAMDEYAKATDMVSYVQQEVWLIALKTMTCGELLQAEKDKIKYMSLLMKPSIRQHMQDSYVYMLRNISIEDIQSYMNILETEQSKKLTDIIMKAIKEGFVSGYENFMQSWSIPNEVCAEQEVKA